MNDWITIDPLEPLSALRKLACLSLAQAAQLAGLRSHSTIEMMERREGVDGRSTTIGTLVKRGKAWGLELRIQVRRLPARGAGGRQR